MGEATLEAANREIAALKTALEKKDDLHRKRVNAMSRRISVLEGIDGDVAGPTAKPNQVVWVHVVPPPLQARGPKTVRDGVRSFVLLTVFGGLGQCRSWGGTGPSATASRHPPTKNG
ncbi:hypothetical protein CAEBREN_02568 [Caenorhabditis brenneri]|uniref:Uncharacterized protein n=1 Tax=Caenorhabditis brenneri TaxID=135651 RepID=G0NYA1_CAEBE|nr:hypothetical protein CAEBREN_02568 [Caenorhabditis brenneri]